VPYDHAANGVFDVRLDSNKRNWYQNKIGSIKDGAGLTIMLSENVRNEIDVDDDDVADETVYWNAAYSAPGPWSAAQNMEVAQSILWLFDANNPGNPDEFGHVSPLNQHKEEPLGPSHAAPASEHSGGFNVAMCDGSSRFLSEMIDYSVFCRIMTPDGAKALQPGDTNADATTAPNPALRQWQNAKVNAGDLER
jgi:prepilin-type processing-associated H-X9-DG protein